MDVDPPKPFAKKLQEKLAASRFFTFSLLLHTVLVVMGGSVVLFQHYAEPPDFAASEGGLVTSDVDVAAPPDPPADPTQQTFTPEAPSIPAPQLAAIATTNTSTPTFQVAAAVPVVKAMPTDAMNKALESKPVMKSGPSGVPGAMAGRIGGQNRQKMMDQLGGKKKAEEAVLRGLRWLVKTQADDGSWSKEYKPAMTGFALLSFLGHGELPNSQEFGPTVQKGLDWLVTNGTMFQGRLSLTQGGWGGNNGVYEHAIAAYALGEYYTMTKDEKVAELLKQAVTHIVKGQAADGGWSYGYVNKPESDTSVSGWQIQALKAAHLSGLNIEGVDAALDKAMLNLKRVQKDDGSFGYLNASTGRYSLTGAGVLCTYFWKQDKNELVRDGIKFILENSMDKNETREVEKLLSSDATPKEQKAQLQKKNPVIYKAERADLYAWYYNTQACLMVGGPAWTKWNRLFQDEVCDSQQADGSWPAIKSKAAVGGLQEKVDGAGPFYRTNLCILMLEVFYRYSPTMK